MTRTLNREYSINQIIFVLLFLEQIFWDFLVPFPLDQWCCGLCDWLENTCCRQWLYKRCSKNTVHVGGWNKSPKILSLLHLHRKGIRLWQNWNTLWNAQFAHSKKLELDIFLECWLVTPRSHWAIATSKLPGHDISFHSHWMIANEKAKLFFDFCRQLCYRHFKIGIRIHSFSMGTNLYCLVLQVWILSSWNPQDRLRKDLSDKYPIPPEGSTCVPKSETREN